MKKQGSLRCRNIVLAAVAITAGMGLSMSATAAMSVTQLEQSRRSVVQSDEIVVQPFNDLQSYYVRAGQSLSEGARVQGSGSSSIEVSCGNGSRLVASDHFQLTVIDASDGGCSVFLQRGALTVVSKGNVQVQMQNAVASANEGTFQVALEAQGVTMSMYSGEGAFDYQDERFPVNAYTKIVLGSISGLTLDTASQSDVEAVAMNLARVDAAKSSAAENDGSIYQARKQFYEAEFTGVGVNTTALTVDPVARYTLEIELSAEIDAQDNIASIVAPNNEYKQGKGIPGTAYSPDVNTYLFDSSSVLGGSTDQYGRPVP